MFFSHIQLFQGGVGVIRDARKKGGQRITKSGGIPLFETSDRINDPTVDLPASRLQD